MDKMILWSLYFLVILGIGFCQNAPLDESCTTNNYNGTCIIITSCPSALSLLKSKDTKTLINMACGFEATHPKVCCPPAADSSSIIFNNNTEETATSRPKKTTTPKSEEPTTLLPDIASDPFPDRRVCGQAKETIPNRIFGGPVTEIDEFPWLARINYLNYDNKTTFACSASLITDRYLITAAHCVAPDNPMRPISIRLGEWDEQTENDCTEKNDCNDKPVDISISKVINHPKYNKLDKSKYDIALLELSEPVTFTAFIQPICLPTTEYIAMHDYVDDRSYWTAGWGITEYGGTSHIKRKVKLEAVATDICQGIITSIPKSSFPSLICAGGRKDKDSCRGDSGGPLVREEAENYQNNWYLFGITSLGVTTCGTEGVPGLYTRVTSYMDWIKSNINS